MRNLLIIALLFFTSHARASDVIDDISPRFFRALRLQEVGDGPTDRVGDGGLALGVFQIHKAYFRDAQEYDRHNKGRFGVYGKWEDCLKDEQLSRRVVTAWIHKNMLNSYRKGKIRNLFMAHNGGSGIFSRMRSRAEKDRHAVANAQAYADHAMKIWYSLEK